MDDFSDSAVRDKLFELQQNFFASFAKGSEALQLVLDSWEGFKESLASVELSSHTLGLVYTFAKAMRDISTGIMELHRTSNGVADKLTIDVMEILNENMVEASTGTKLSYIEPSCKWLLENLHNPYPSKETRDAISTQTGCPRRYIDNWFIDVRKRIGWNTLRRTHFSNKRMEAIDAATRFFIKDDPGRPLTIAIEMEFATIQARARLLHAGTFKESPSTIVEEITTCTGGQEQGASSYPSPESSPEPLLRTSMLPATTVYVSARPDRKRRNSAINLEVNPASLPSKRPRFDVDHGFPLPAWSVDDLESTSNKRKRRLSDGGCHGFPKRICHDISPGPRLHTVSDPTPLDEWFRDFVESVSVDAPDPSALLDINVYDCSRFDLQKQSSGLASPFHIFSTDNDNDSSSDLLSFGDNESLLFHSSASLPESIINSPLFVSSCITPQLEAGPVIPPSGANITF